jgi:hypothetical protein
MRNIVFLMALILSPCTALAIKPASTGELVAIQSLIDQANEINEAKSPNSNVRYIVLVERELDREQRAQGGDPCRDNRNIRCP